MLHNALAPRQLHRSIRGERYVVGIVKPAEHLSEASRVASGSLRPQPTSSGEERPNFGLDDAKSLASDPKALLSATRPIHGTILAPLQADFAPTGMQMQAVLIGFPLRQHGPLADPSS